MTNIKTKSKLNWSNYQKDVFNNVKNGNGHTAIIARAGSSKTTTLVESLKYVPKGKKILVAAFNKIIAEELKERISSKVDCMTLHSLGYRAIKLKFGNNVVLDNKKVFAILQSIHNNNDFELFQEVAKTVSFCKASLADIPSKISDLIDEYGIDCQPLERDEFVKLVIKTLRVCKEQTNIIDFDDMIYFPFVYNLDVGKWDYVFVDECQDLNISQIVMALSAAKKNSRIFAFLDDRQAIYGFRCSNIKSVNSIIEKLNPTKLPLPITYRCPLRIVAMAQEIVPDLQPAPFAKEGSIQNISPDEMMKLVKPGDFILSRTNAPLIKYCMNLLKNNIPANIQGRDVGSNLLSFVKKSKAKTIDKFLKYVNDWEDIEIKRLLNEKKDTQTTLDKVECLRNLCEGILTINELKDNIDKLFNDVDDKHRIVLSTVHRAKGLERDNVFVLRNTFRRGMNAEEDNIFYVAITRSRDKLFMVSK